MKFLALLFALCAYISADVMFSCVDHRDIVKEFLYDPGTGGMSVIDVINSEGIKFVSYAPNRQLWGVTSNGYVKKKSENEGAIYTDSRIGSGARDISAHYDVYVSTNNGYDIYTKSYSGGSWSHVFSPAYHARSIEVDCDEDVVLYYNMTDQVYSYSSGYQYQYPDPPGTYVRDLTCRTDATILTDYIYKRLAVEYDAGYQYWGIFVDWQDDLLRIDCGDKGIAELRVDPYNNNTFVYYNRTLVYSAYGEEWQDIAIEQ